MNLLFDINHPAHVHFFRTAIRRLKNSGHAVWVTAREKEMTTSLLDRYGIAHEVVSRKGDGMMGLAKELVLHEGRLLRRIRRHSVQAVLAIGGTFMVHACRLLGIPSLVFYDTENAKFQNAITYPFATRIYTPVCYEGQIGSNQIRYNGYHELAYLHPNHFKPDASILKLLGVAKGDVYTIMRFVGWGATHDMGHNGLTEDSKRRAIEAFHRFGKVFITSERGLPKDLRAYALPTPHDRIHDALAFATLCYGESATMASESCVLGTPAIYIDDEGRGYTNEQEARYGAVFNFSESLPHQHASIDKGVEILSDPGAKRKWQLKRHQLLAEKIDVTAMIVEAVERLV
jgi:uncharacterized protein